VLCKAKLQDFSENLHAENAKRRVRGLIILDFCKAWSVSGFNFPLSTANYVVVFILEVSKSLIECSFAHLKSFSFML
jgi:hypothetical protein